MSVFIYLVCFYSINPLKSQLWDGLLLIGVDLSKRNNFQHFCLREELEIMNSGVTQDPVSKIYKMVMLTPALEQEGVEKGREPSPPGVL